jgi:hypothetical protein
MGVDEMNMSLTGTMWMPIPNFQACVDVAKVFGVKTFWITDNGAVKEFTLFDGKFREVEDDGKTCEAN